jgi:hypothetical protein
MTGSREALIIATGTYEDPELRRLRAPAQDASALGRVLADPFIGGFQVESVVDQPERVIRRAAQRFFSDRGLDDLLLVHLSCHGVKDDDGRLYFAALDTEKKWLESTGVPASFMIDRMEHCRARSIILLLDCCYSGAFLPGAKGDEGVHLKEKFEGEGRAILTASNSIEYSWEGQDLKGTGAPSVFTDAIVEGLETGEADRDRDGSVSVEDLYKHVYEKVREAKRGQTPLKWEFGIAQDLYVARNPHPVEIEPAGLPHELQVALENPYPNVREGCVNELRKLLGSSHVALALAARNALEDLLNDDSRAVSSAAKAALGGRQQLLQGSDAPESFVMREKKLREVQEHHSKPPQSGPLTKPEEMQDRENEGQKEAREELALVARQVQEREAKVEAERLAIDREIPKVSSIEEYLEGVKMRLAALGYELTTSVAYGGHVFPLVARKTEAGATTTYLPTSLDTPSRNELRSYFKRCLNYVKSVKTQASDLSISWYVPIVVGVGLFPPGAKNRLTGVSDLMWITGTQLPGLTSSGVACIVDLAQGSVLFSRPVGSMKPILTRLRWIASPAKLQ